MGGANDSLGLVEVCINNGWGGVCSDRFGTFDAEVVCNQLGFFEDGMYSVFYWTRYGIMFLTLTFHRELYCIS